MSRRIRLTSNYVDGKLASVTFSKGQGSFSMRVRDEKERRDGNDTTEQDHEQRRRMTFAEWAARYEDRSQP
jgi:hypothetical protein